MTRCVRGWMRGLLTWWLVARAKRGDSRVVELPAFDPHPAQLRVLECPARFVALVAGRRWGKTRMAGWLCVYFALRSRGSVVWWVAPTAAQTRLGRREVLRFLPRSLRHVNATLGEITLVNGSRIFMKSASKPDNLRGEGVDFMIVDEAAMLREEVWTEVLRPMLSDRLGAALLCSTYKGENWFYRLSREWGSGSVPDSACFVSDTSQNPYFPADEL